jgi:hypothetical protein
MFPTAWLRPRQFRYTYDRDELDTFGHSQKNFKDFARKIAAVVFPGKNRLTGRGTINAMRRRVRPAFEGALGEFPVFAR